MSIQNDRKERHNQAVKKYQQSEKGKAIRRRAEKRRYNTIEGKIVCKRAYKKYYSTINGYLRRIFYNMNQRCNYPKRKDYKNYGGRGIKNKFKSLDDFRNYVINELQVDPRGLQIDRINNDGHYEPGNIRFVTHEKNQQNKRL